MASEMDFPANPTVGQGYVNSFGVMYVWNGVAWVIGVSAADQSFSTIDDIMGQIRTLLQDTDPTIYRYSDQSLVQNINMCLWEMYRMRPDIFLSVGFVVPQFLYGDTAVPWPLEPQWVPPLVYYVVGLTQLRDDEATQDQRAAQFLTKFTSTMASLA